MTDEQARDEAAFQYGIQFEDNVSAEQDFKAGWTACLKGPAVTDLQRKLDIAKRALGDILGAHKRGCVTYKDCDCWWQTAQDALNEIEKN